MSRPDIPPSLRRLIAERDGWRCSYCRLSQIGQAATFHIDHIWPWSRGGPTAVDNLAFQCTGCGLHKSDRVELADPLTGRPTPLFHPLNQIWAEHFAISPDGVCHGLTAVGRATVAALAMNEHAPRAARRIQISSGLLTIAEELP